MNGITAPWRPNGRTLSLRSTKAAWARLDDLINLDWATPAEQAERKVLFRWLRSFRLLISNSNVMSAVETTCDINLAQSSSAVTAPLYKLGEQIWSNFVTLSGGDTLPPARPSLVPDDDGMSTKRYAELETSKAQQQTQAEQWFDGCMRLLDWLMANDLLHAYDVGSAIGPELSQYLRRRTAEQIIDDAYTVGASLFFEPGLPGTGFGLDGEVVYVCSSLAHAVRLFLRDLSESTDDESTARILTYLNFQWGMLKGLVWAGSTSSSAGISLPALFNARPWVWEMTKSALIDGLDALLAAGPEKQLANWTHHSRGRGTAIGADPISHLVERMEALVAEAATTAEAMRNVR